jgi:hypothetical protein
MVIPEKLNYLQASPDYLQVVSEMLNVHFLVSFSVF